MHKRAYMSHFQSEEFCLFISEADQALLKTMIDQLQEDPHYRSRGYHGYRNRHGYRKNYGYRNRYGYRKNYGYRNRYGYKSYLKGKGLQKLLER